MDHPASPVASFSIPTLLRETWLTLTIMLVFAVGGVLVASLVLGTHVLLGACVAFCLMLFIGLPLCLATMLDDLESHGGR